MKAVRYYVAMTVAAVILCVSAHGRMEPSALSERPFLIGQPHPALVGIDGLHAVLLRSGADPNAGELDWTQLKADVTSTLDQANIRLSTPTADGGLNIPELRVYVNLLKLADSHKYVFRIQTSIARAVCLKDRQDPVFKADLWTISPAFEAVSVEDMPARITDVVLEQIETFIQAYKAANPRGEYPSAFVASPAPAPQGQTEADTRSPTAARGYVASNSSDIFHKPDCRWAKNISPENLITYTTREQAVTGGKRPCKWCKP